MVDSKPKLVWAERVAFSEQEGFAYRPDEVLVHRAGQEAGDRVLGIGNAREEHGSFLRYGAAGQRLQVRGENSDPLRAIEELRLEGVYAQPNHVVFSQCACCGPHPAVMFANPFSSNPFSSNPFSSNPFSSNPFSSNPFSSNPFSSNPFSSNPFSSNHLPSPLALLASGAPESQTFRATGVRRNSARPASAPLDAPQQARAVMVRTAPSIVVVDTGLANAELRPQALSGLSAAAITADDESPDENNDTQLDPVAGHGTFIAGVIEGIVPGCELRVDGLVNGEGDANEVDVADKLVQLANLTDGTRPDLVNLSFGGYTVTGMARLQEAVRTLQDKGTVVVASAGNDATCVPSYPAALPGVISVGAIGRNGPAHFTNYGPWVRACAPGVDIVSTFFKEVATTDGKGYGEWACWSGTSFAAPAVLAALAEQMRLGRTGAQAVQRVLDAPGLLRIPGLGTVVNRQPWC